FQRLSDNSSENLRQITTLSEDKTSLEVILLDLKQQFKAAQDILKQHSDKKNSLYEEITSFEKSLNGVKLELQKKLSKIEYLTNLLNSMEDYAEGIKYLVKDRKESNIGTVIDMLEVEDRYKVAVETA